MSVFRRLVNVGRGKVQGWAQELPDPDGLLDRELRERPPAPPDDRLARLARARDRGDLSAEEHEARRAAILLERAAEQGRAAASEDTAARAPEAPEGEAPAPTTPRKRRL